MAKIPSFNPIEYLVRRRHPNVNALEAASANNSGLRARSPSYEKVLRHKRAADASRNELTLKKPAEIDELVKAEKKKEREETVAHLAQEDRRLFHKLFWMPADFDHYCKAAYWTLDECVALSLGKDPKQVNWKTVQPHTNISFFAFRYEKLRDLTKRAEWAGQLFDPVRPSIYLAWAKQQKIELADELVSRTVNTGLPLKNWSYLFEQQKAQSKTQVEEQNKKVEELEGALREARTEIDALRQHRPTNQANLQASDSNKPLNTKERDSLLKLVMGMAVGGYRYDPHQSRNAATKDIQDDIQTLGLGMDGDTVRKYLKQGAELISPETLEHISRKPSSAKR